MFSQSWFTGVEISKLEVKLLPKSVRCLLRKKVREKPRECHNHKPQPFPDPKRKRKPTNLNKHKPNKRTKSTKISSLFPNRGNRNTKRTEKHICLFVEGYFTGVCLFLMGFIFTSVRTASWSLTPGMTLQAATRLGLFVMTRSRMLLPHVGVAEHMRYIFC